MECRVGQNLWRDYKKKFSITCSVHCTFVIVHPLHLDHVVFLLYFSEESRSYEDLPNILLIKFKPAILTFGEETLVGSKFSTTWLPMNSSHLSCSLYDFLICKSYRTSGLIYRDHANEGAPSFMQSLSINPALLCLKKPCKDEGKARRQVNHLQLAFSRQKAGKCGLQPRQTRGSQQQQRSLSPREVQRGRVPVEGETLLLLCP